MVDRALTQPPNCLLPSNAYTHMKVDSGAKSEYFSFKKKK
jgi:hypothetical protein